MCGMSTGYVLSIPPARTRPVGAFWGLEGPENGCEHLLAFPPLLSETRTAGGYRDVFDSPEHREDYRDMFDTPPREPEGCASYGEAGRPRAAS